MKNERRFRTYLFLFHPLQTVISNLQFPFIYCQDNSGHIKVIIYIEFKQKHILEGLGGQNN